MSQALYNKWRPHLWDEVVSQEHVVHTLQNAVRSERIGHAYLFAGPRGTGKTSMARLLAKAVNCLETDLAKRPCDQCDHCTAINQGRFLDLIEIDAASNTSVDDVRELRDKINFAPSQGRFKVYLIDEVHMLSTAAFNALLKTLEEPPGHAIFILATTEVHKIPATVLSRCQRHEFRRIPLADIVGHIQALAEREGIEIEPEALTLIARNSTGAMRDAISLLDQLSSVGEKITLGMAQEVLGTATSQNVIDIVDAILQRQPAAGMNGLHAALDGGSDPRQFARQVVDYLRNLLLIKMGSGEQVDATAEMRAVMEQHAQAFEVSVLMNALRLFNHAATETRTTWQPGLLLELALAEAIEFDPDPSLSSRPVQRPAPRPIDRPAAQPAGGNVAPTRQAEPSLRETFEQTAPPAQPRPKADERPASSRSSEAAASAQAPVSNQPAEVQPAGQAAAGGETVSFDEIARNWKRITRLVRERSKPTEALLNSCRPVVIKDGVLVLGFQTEVLRQKMATPENIEMTCQAIQSILGSTLRVHCVVVNAKGGLPPELDVEGDGMVGTALNLGGHIVHKE